MFTGPSVQRALAAARAAHGRDVQVLKAVRRTIGLRGLLGQASYEVVVRRRPATTVTVLPPAAAAPVAARGTDPVLSALDDLLSAADERERDTTGDPTPSADGVVRAGIDDSAWTWAQQQEVERLLEELGARSGTPGAHPALEMTAHAPAPAALPAPVAQPPAAWPVAEDGEVEDALTYEPPRFGTGWDRAELRRLGVPAGVLSRLPVEDPPDDEEWRRCLRRAIAAVVPAPGRPDEQHPIVVSGYGLLGAVEILRAGSEDAATPGTISWNGKRRAATPAALVEVLASCARS